MKPPSKPPTENEYELDEMYKAFGMTYKPPQTIKRTCLMCTVKFSSTHKGNRVCTRCRRDFAIGERD